MEDTKKDIYLMEADNVRKKQKLNKYSPLNYFQL